MEGDLQQEGERKPRLKMKRHRPKIFDLMKPKTNAPKPKAQPKPKKPKPEKKEKQKSGKSDPEVEEKKNLQLIEWKKSPEIEQKEPQIKITNSDIIWDSKFCDPFNNDTVLGGKVNMLKFLQFPVPKRKRWSILKRKIVGNRIHYLPIDSVTSDSSSKMNTPLSFPVEENVEVVDLPKTKAQKEFESSMDDLEIKMSNLTINNNEKQIVIHNQNILVGKQGRKRKKPEPPKVFSDADAMKSWILIKEDGKEKKDECNYWKAQRGIFLSRVEMFIGRMHLIQGNRAFSKWKGSVVDSVIGVFLTQNVADNMSSDCFMRFVARFPNSINTTNIRAPIISYEGVTDSDDETNENLERVSTEETNETRTTKKKKNKKKEEEIGIDWEEFRKKYDTLPKDTTSDFYDDAIDWDAVRRASTSEVAETVGKRGMQNMLAAIIKKFLDRLVQHHGKIDLEWLRNVPTEKVREYLLSFERIGLKSLDCVRLLTLHHHAFPVDTNVARIVVRLGWIPLQPLPDGVQLHLLNDYPNLAAIQEYLWPRLKFLRQQKLYELHYQMITFGKVFCTKQKPRCDVCPMKTHCNHYASAQKYNLRLQGEEAKEVVYNHLQITLPSQQQQQNEESIEPPDISECENEAKNYEFQNCEPIVEIPASPDINNSSEIPERIDIVDIEDQCNDNLNFDFKDAIESSMALQQLVGLDPEATYFGAPTLKNTRRLHTEHHVYVLPDGHPLLAEFDRREMDDPVHYLFAIWLSEDEGNEHKDEQTVLGTILVPCRTANKGRFALNGTYFQVNEVFADYETSMDPIRVPSYMLWNLEKRIIYCAPSGRSIFKDMTRLEIHNCFWRGYICVRCFNRKTREPSKLHIRFHTNVQKLKREKKKKRAADATATATAEAADANATATAEAADANATATAEAADANATATVEAADAAATAAAAEADAAAAADATATAEAAGIL